MPPHEDDGWLTDAARRMWGAETGRRILEAERAAQAESEPQSAREFWAELRREAADG